jgi:hypothetical protein
MVLWHKLLKMWSLTLKTVDFSAIFKICLFLLYWLGPEPHSISAPSPLCYSLRLRLQNTGILPSSGKIKVQFYTQELQNTFLENVIWITFWNQLWYIVICDSWSFLSTKGTKTMILHKLLCQVVPSPCESVINISF